MGKMSRNEMENEQRFCQHHQGVRGVASCPICGNILCTECAELNDAIDFVDQKTETGVGAMGCSLCNGDLKISLMEKAVEHMKNRAKRRFVMAIIAIVIAVIWMVSIAFDIEGNLFERLFAALLFVPLIAYVFVGVAYVAGDLARCVVNWIIGFFKVFLSFSSFNLFSFFVALCVSAIVPIFKMYVLGFKMLIVPIPETLAMRKFLREVDGELETCKRAARTYIDYAKYVDILDKVENKDMRVLMSTNGALYNNSYAQMVAEQGKDYAENTMLSVKNIVRVNCKELKGKYIDRRFGKAGILSKIK